MEEAQKKAYTSQEEQFLTPKEKSGILSRPIDQKRIQRSVAILDDELNDDDRWYLHSIMTQCFMPYRDPKQDSWVKSNGDYGVAIQSGIIPPFENNAQIKRGGIPYGAKPRLINCYIQTHAVKFRTPIIPIEQSMSSFMKALGFKVTGGEKGSIRQFQEQSTRLSTSKWTIWGPNKTGQGVSQFNAEQFKRIDLWFPSHLNQKSLWPSELELTTDFFESLINHAIPYDYRAIKLLKANARAQDVYLWLTQRLHRISKQKPLKLDYKTLYCMFGGGITEIRKFPLKFDEALKTALLAYPEANVEKFNNQYFLFKSSPPPIKKIQLMFQ